MRTMNSEGVVDTSTDVPVIPESKRNLLMLQKAPDFELDHLVENEDGTVKVTTQQSRMTRALVSAIQSGMRAADAVAKYDEDPEKAFEPGEAQVKTADLYDYVRGLNLVLTRGITKEGCGLNHFKSLKMVVNDTLESVGLAPEIFTGNVIPHFTEMYEIGERLGAFSDTITVDGEDETTEYEEGDGSKYDGVEEVSWTKKDSDATFRSVWCRLVSITMTIEVQDEDGNLVTKDICPLDQPSHPFFESQDSKYWFGSYYYGPQYMVPQATGANLHNLGNQAITYKLGGEWVETCEENLQKYLEATASCSKKEVEAAFKRAEKNTKKEKEVKKKTVGKKTEKQANLDNLAAWTNRLKYAKKSLRRSSYELALQAVVNFGQGLKAEMLKQLFTLAENGTYAQNPIRHEKLLRQVSWQMKRDPNQDWDVVKGFKAWITNPKRTLEDLLEILEGVDLTTVFCKPDGAPRNGKAAGLINEVKEFIKAEVYADFNDDEEGGLVSLSSRQKHLVKQVEAKTTFAATQQEAVENAVQPLKGVKATKKTSKKTSKKKVTKKKTTKKTAKKQ